MVNVWAARSSDGLRIRIQTEPFAFAWSGWEIRSGEVPAELHELMVTTTDDVEMERAHRDIWALLQPVE